MTATTRNLAVSLTLLALLWAATLGWMWSQTRALQAQLAALSEQVASNDANELRARLDETSSAAAQASEEAARANQRIGAAYIAGGLVLEEVARQLETFESQTLTMTVPIREQIPVNATIPLDERFEVPIQLDVPIRTTVNVPLRLGLLGEYNLDIPIDTTVPIDLTVPIHIQRDVPVRTTVPLDLEVPVSLSLAETPLAGQMAGWRASIEGFLDDLRQANPAGSPGEGASSGDN